MTLTRTKIFWAFLLGVGLLRLVSLAKDEVQLLMVESRVMALRGPQGGGHD